MKLHDHLLTDDNGIPFPLHESPNKSGTITPGYLVIHYTAGRSAEGSISWLTNPNAKASAHLVISRDGQIAQLVPFNLKAWHAGESRWAGRSGVNGFSIGIELDNPGVLQKRVRGWTNAWGDPVDDANVIEAAHKNGGPVRGWHDYGRSQLDTLRQVAIALVGEYRLVDIIGHDDVAPERKTDPGPAFPMESLRAALFGRDADSPKVCVATTRLNVRSGPGVDHDRLAFSPLAQGTRMEILAESGVWRQVDVLEAVNGETHLTGWVHSHYIAPA